MVQMFLCRNRETTTLNKNKPWQHAFIDGFYPCKHAHTHTHTHKHTHTHTHTQSTSVHKSATWLQMFLAHTSEEFNVGRLRVMLQPAHISRKLWHLLTKSRHVQHPAAWYCAFFFTWKIKWKQQPRNFWEIWAELMSSDPETCRK